MLLLRAMCVLLILSGIAGVAVGDESAVAGWWLIVVFSSLLAVTFIGDRSSVPSDMRNSRMRSRLVTAGGVVLGVLILVPLAMLMLAGSADGIR